MREDASLTTAHRLLWLAVIFDFLAFGVGFEWDKRWHATHAFEDFFSPLHLFIYTIRRRSGRALPAPLIGVALFIVGSSIANPISGGSLPCRRAPVW